MTWTTCPSLNLAKLGDHENAGRWLSLYHHTNVQNTFTDDVSVGFAKHIYKRGAAFGLAKKQRSVAFGLADKSSDPMHGVAENCVYIRSVH